ncbi:Signal peptidase I [Vibrio aerogenes CECT 7868]|uniref:Signal peptidase I n=1 Tax=Vibrio aerogenes CECT 7868 TaxID=1216006 RepID=A0A1M5YI33_9VIBR|nr:signal peptidase I [Vibrio aerogenes]SHI11670.1 Signal peptidase I [Vibrio aerogenes CECT 7868]
MANTFSLILVLVTIVTGIIWALEKWVWAKKRQLKFAELQAQTNDLDTSLEDKVLPQPWWVENSVSIFPVIALVLVIRSFIFEPFQIPSGSMKPTLLVGDFILVEKFAYGLKDPVMHSTIVKTGKPERGDIAVFRYPPNPSVDYIKRVVGLPGDIVRYSNEKQLCIQPRNESVCKPVPLSDVQKSNLGVNGMPLLQLSEKLGDVDHHILINPWRPVHPQDYQPRPGVSEWIVPEGHYFMMGDNRDNSADSRYWGFVPERNLVGKAVAIWISFEFNRDADSSLPSWIPTNVRFNRVGRIH